MGETNGAKRSERANEGTKERTVCGSRARERWMLEMMVQIGWVDGWGAGIWTRIHGDGDGDGGWIGILGGVIGGVGGIGWIVMCGWGDEFFFKEKFHVGFFAMGFMECLLFMFMFISMSSITVHAVLDFSTSLIGYLGMRMTCVPLPFGRETGGMNWRQEIP
ncbi:hypothetical protein B0J11DRAFT_127277 [Dendryphion nanum]|uniref:Uncharacterized protein n=1 Tax=Dendryphion nanum TaxID=256645 RepID=A0A9P9D7N3_9PLEO|nr:hypothetical protein B0J11DRAFT_127277 [Dendryphion nanum]